MTSGASHFEHGKQALADDHGLEALRAFEAAYNAEPENAEYESYFALVNALERGRVREGLQLARKAAERAPEIVTVHLNLARILLQNKDKAGAIDTLRRGLVHHPDNEELTREVRRLGVRKPPVFKSLSRDHPLNKYAGKLKHWLQRQ
jgi:predicted Zn-dependent protease